MTAPTMELDEEGLDEIGAAIAFAYHGGGWNGMSEHQRNQWRTVAKAAIRAYLQHAQKKEVERQANDDAAEPFRIVIEDRKDGGVRVSCINARPRLKPKSTPPSQSPEGT